MTTIERELMSIYSGDPMDMILVGNTTLSHAYEAQGMSGRTAEASSNGIGSGRYRKGSGAKPYQHGIGDFLERVDYYKKQGITKDTELAKLCGCKSSTDYRIAYSVAINNWKRERAAKAQEMLDSGKYGSKKAVAEALGIRDTTLNSWLNPKSLERVNRSSNMADFLRKQVDEKKMIDVGEGIAKELNISETKLREAIAILEGEGYQLLGGRVPQATNPGKKTVLSVLAAPDQQWSDLYNHPEKIQSINDYIVKTDDQGNEVIQRKWQRPAKMDPSRLMIRYADDIAPDGHPGIDRDGTIEIRRNVPDLDLKGSHYAQVRILLENNKYLKGMAVYSDDIPDGYDVVFNTNKTRDKADIVLKNAKSDPDNPFGALLRNEGGQYEYIDKNGEKKLGLINKTRQEGDWEEWNNTLPSQFLAKQPIALIEKQLNKTIADKQKEYQELLSLTNPTLKKSLLNDFAEACDSDMVHMQAAGLPRQKYQVLLPVPTLKDDEVYAPNFKEGETIAVVRFPNQGLFEIPILKVTHKNPQGRAMIGENPIDAIGLNKNNLDRLSGADTDGDTGMCIPCNDPRFSDTKIANQPLLEGLIGFDPKVAYGYDNVETRLEKVKKTRKYRDENGKVKEETYWAEENVDHYFRNGHEFKPMTRTQMEMGIVSILMMDATQRGASDEDKTMIARHCQVVIDAEKHHLDWKQSEIDNHIKELKKKYQERIEESDGSVHYGAATLITRAKSPVQVNKTTGQPHINPETGKLEYKESQMKPQVYVDKKGKERIRTEEVPLLATKESATELIRDPYNPKEVAYARYSDTLRALAAEARKEITKTGDIEYNKQAEVQYHDEVQHLMDELATAKANAPRERMAQLYSRGIVLAKQRDNLDMTPKEIKKAAQSALAEGRVRFNAHRHTIDISPKEWEAIQSGAVKKTALKDILKFADGDQVRKYAMPKQTVNLTTGQEARIRAALAKGTPASVLAEQFGVSASTINSYRK